MFVYACRCVIALAFSLSCLYLPQNPQTKTKRNQKHRIAWAVHSKTKSSQSTAQVEQDVQTSPPQKKQTNPSLCQFCVKWYFTLSAYLTSPATKNSSGVSSSFALYLAMSFSAIGWISSLAGSNSPSSSASALTRKEKQSSVKSMKKPHGRGKDEQMSESSGCKDRQLEDRWVQRWKKLHVQMVLSLVVRFGLASGDTRVVSYFEGHHFALSNSFPCLFPLYTLMSKSFSAIHWKNSFLFCISIPVLAYK